MYFSDWIEQYVRIRHSLRPSLYKPARKTDVVIHQPCDYSTPEKMHERLLFNNQKILWSSRNGQVLPMSNCYSILWSIGNLTLTWQKRLLTYLWSSLMKIPEWHIWCARIQMSLLQLPVFVKMRITSAGILKIQFIFYYPRAPFWINIITITGVSLMLKSQQRAALLVQWRVGKVPKWVSTFDIVQNHSMTYFILQRIMN